MTLSPYLPRLAQNTHTELNWAVWVSSACSCWLAFARPSPFSTATMSIPTQTQTATSAESTIESFSTTSQTGVGPDGEGFDKTNDFAAATGGADAFSERPNDRTLEQVADEKEGSGSKLGAFLFVSSL